MIRDHRTVKEIYRHIADMGYAGKYRMVKQTVDKSEKLASFNTKLYYPANISSDSCIKK